jgi:hypothetical protein
VVIVLGILVVAGAGIFGLCSLADRLLPDYSEGPWRTAKEYYDAINAGDYGKAHAQLTPALGRELTQGDLYELFSMAESRGGRITHLVHERFRVDETGRVKLDVGVERERELAVVTMYLIKMGDRWRIDEFASP